jgi:hypothetical protein
MLSHIETACDFAAQGKVIDMSALKNDADSLCTQILRLPPAEARDFQPLIGELITSLDRLEHLLRAVTNGEA